ncbi:MAG: BMC domain-containing protein [Candidatus Heimdallarchaeota archaeon]|nr:MAG: BMC domain-containing protein [Candidatus Heimdallarchaeota archaeon]
MSAIGFIETSGRLGAIVATDVALKTANVRLLSLHKASGGLVTVIIQGDVAAVQVAIDTAQVEAQLLCEYITTNVIPKPANDTISNIKMISK